MPTVVKLSKDTPLDTAGAVVALPPGTPLDGEDQGFGAAELPQDISLAASIERGVLTRRSPNEKVQGPDSADPLDRTLTVLGAGANEGMASILGLPVDVVNWALGKVGVPVSDTPFAGRKSIIKAMRYLGIPEVEATNAYERIVKRVGEEVGANTIGFGAVGGAVRGARGASQAIKPPTYADAFTKPFIETPGKTAAVETGLSISAGTGAGLANEAFPGSPVADIVGQLAGGLTPSAITSVVRGAARPVANVVRRFSPAGIEKRAGSNLVKSAEDPEAVIRALDKAAEIPDSTGFRPTTAQASQDPGVRSLETLSAKGSPRIAGSLETRRAANNAALRQSFEKLAPDSTLGPEAVREALTGRIGQITKALDKRIAKAETKAKNVAGREPLSSEDASAALRGELEAALKDARAVERDLWRQVDPEGTLTVDTVPLKEAMAKWEGGLTKAERLSVPDDILRIVGKAEKETPNSIANNDLIDEVTSIRTEIITAAREARSAGNFRKARLLGQMDDVVLGYLDNLDINEAYNAARAFSRELNEKFTRGQIGRVLKSNRQGGDVVPESGTAAAFFKSGAGAPEAAKQLISAVGDRPRAIKAVRDHALNDLYRVATDADGNVNPTRLKIWMKKHSSALDQFPELRKELSTVVKAESQLADIRTAKTRTLDEVEKGAARLFLDADPDKAVSAALSSKNPQQALIRVRQLIRNSPEGMNGLRRSVWNELAKSADSGVRDTAGELFVDPKNLRKFLNKNRKALAVVYNKEDLGRLHRIANLAEMNFRRGTMPSAVQATATSQALGLNQMLSRFYAIQRGVVSKRFIASEVSARLLNRVLDRATNKQLEVVMERALLDPEFAALLMRKASPRTEREIAKRIRLFIATAPVTAQQDTEQQPRTAQ